MRNILNLDQWFRCRFKIFLIWSYGGTLFIGNEHYEERFGEIILNFDQWFRCRLKYYLEVWRLSCSAEWNHLGNFGRRPSEEHFKFGKVV